MRKPPSRATTDRRRSMRLAVVVLLTLGMAHALAACTGTDGADDPVRTTLEDIGAVVGKTPLRLPSIPIDIDADGRVARIGGIASSEVDALWERMTGSPLVGRIRFFNDDEDGRSYVSWFTATNVQHITIATRTDGLFVMINGQSLPHIAWDAESLDNLLALMDDLRGGGSEALISDAQYEALAEFLPLLSALNLRFDLRFPLQSDASGRQTVDRIPLASDRAFRLEVSDAERAAPALQTVDVEVEYRPLVGGGGWVPALFELSTIDLRTLLQPFGVDVPLLKMDDAWRRRLMAAGIQSAGLQLSEDGLYVNVDERRLPHVAWNERALVNVSNALAQLYPARAQLPTDALWVPIVRTTAPVLNDLSISLLVRFPVAE